jgi:polygalacturonase
MFEKNISEFGGRGDGQFDNSNAFATAFEALKRAGSGTIRVGAGVWRTGPIELFSNTTFILEEDAIVSFIADTERYRPVLTRWEGVECYAMKPLVFADGRKNIVISGKGVFDGSGDAWWTTLAEKRGRGQMSPETDMERELARLNPGYERQPSGGGSREMQFLRPPLMQFRYCSNILLEGFTLKNSPFWTLHPLFCSGVTIRGLTISNPPDAPNTDGIDIDSCYGALVEGCEVAVGDDGIVIKSGSGEDGVRINKPSENIMVRRCTVRDGHGGIVIGSETAAGIFNVIAEDCLFKGTDRGVRIKTRRGRGGEICNLLFRRLTMENNLCPIAINMFYRCGTNFSEELFKLEPMPVVSTTPSIKNISIEHIHSFGCRASAGFMAGLPESPIENLIVTDCEFSTNEADSSSPDKSDMFLGLPSVTSKSFRVLNVRNPIFSNVRIYGPKEAFVYG